MATLGSAMENNAKTVQLSRLELLDKKATVEKNVLQKKIKCERLETAYKKAQEEYLNEEKKLSVVEGKLASTEEALKAAQILDAVSSLLRSGVLPGATKTPEAAENDKMETKEDISEDESMNHEPDDTKPDDTKPDDTKPAETETVDNQPGTNRELKTDDNPPDENAEAPLPTSPQRKVTRSRAE
ncbi:hypothetical protein CALVIDRAFT_103602 [Calocera viscosa TUFC12733]|uniref:Uncharacterized protein n=1 Tax=Calocera viscosa (strain TUFC12733) TaxID=1330018 RepID=A0A167MN93_CALVF|nr:hypothetical protein CALVIDRAFT_103602 [Calocera viscosa TUFC12733]